MMEGPTRVASLASWTLAVAAVVLVAGTLLISPNEQLKRSREVSASGGDGAAKPDSGATVLQPFDASDLIVPPEQILRGGPAKDGIPALLNPNAVAAAEAEFLRPGDRVVGVTLGEQARAYPINVLNWHEIINDELGGVPIAVIYCPLCDSVSVVERRVDGQTLTFGVSGLLYNSNVILYDRTHQSLWSQVGLKALSGPYSGQSLKHLPWQLRPFEAWREDHPEGTVITFETGYARDYRRNPYSAYFRTDRLMFPIARSDSRLPRKSAVVGVQIGTAARAYPLDRIAQADAGRMVDTVAGARVVLRVDAATGGGRCGGGPAGSQGRPHLLVCLGGVSPRHRHLRTESNDPVAAVERAVRAGHRWRMGCCGMPCDWFRVRNDQGASTTEDAAMTKLHGSTELGQAAWLDYVRRSFTRTGELAALIDKGVRGVTSNPSIFEKAIAGSDDYDDHIGRLAVSDKTAAEVYETLTTEDIRQAADLFGPLYGRTGGRDGFVSFEVSPTLAHDTQGTLADAERLFAALGRPNVMIKIPATTAGIPAIEAAIADGINVNVTLIFSLEQYEAAAEAYMAGLQRRLLAGRQVRGVASVASVFVSRLDTAVDSALEAVGRTDLQGRAAVDNARLVYARFRQTFAGNRWEKLACAGARVQRPLWASTATKNPAYPDTLYVDNLIGPDTVNTVPRATLDAFLDHGQVAITVDRDLAGARQRRAELQELGIDLETITARLLDDGVAAFAGAYEGLLSSIEGKREKLARQRRQTS